MKNKSITILIFLLTLKLFSQSNNFEVISYQINSGIYQQNTTESTKKVFETSVNLFNTVLLRLHFNSYNLGNRSYIRVYVVKDSSYYDLYQNDILYFENSSPYFTGNSITLSLYHHPEDRNIFFSIDSILISNNHICVTTGICGQDDRVKDNTIYKDAIGRLYARGTAWITANKKILTNYHVYAQTPYPGWGHILEFNVPESYQNGDPIFAHPNDQYYVDGLLARGYGAEGSDEDWAIIKVRPKYGFNGNLYYPWDKQNYRFEVGQNFVDNTAMRVSGYGCTNPPNLNLNLTLTTSTGNGYYNNNYGFYIYHTVDISGGNSGSPVIDLQNGRAIGLLVQGGCSGTGYNLAISFKKPELWNALEGDKRLTTVNQVDEENSKLDTSVKFGWWLNNSFEDKDNGSEIKLIMGYNEYLRANQNLIGEHRKYFRWLDKDDFENHTSFYVDYNLKRELKAKFLPIVQTLSIKNTFNELGTVDLGKIYFLDPWFIDYQDNKGMKNRGLNPFPHQFDSPFILSMNQNYKGVFLNQGITPQGQWQPPYYSVKTDISQQNITLGQTGKTHKFYFSHWSGNPHGSAEFQYPQNLQSPVVFKQANATVQAKYY